MKKITFLFMTFAMLSFTWQASAQYGCGSGVPITDGYTATGITSPGTGGAEDWNDPNPTMINMCTNIGGAALSAFYFDDDVYLFTYTAGANDEEVSMTINSNTTWTGIAIFASCTGTALDDCMGSSGSTSGGVLTATANIAAGQTVYIGVGQWGTPNALDFDVTSFTATPLVNPPNCDSVLTETTDLSVAGDISWNAATGGPTGYNLTVGTSMGGSEVLTTTAVGDVLTYNLGLLDYATTYYVTIQPTNSNGDASGCTEQSFATEAEPAPGESCLTALPATVESDCAAATALSLDFDTGGTETLTSCDAFGNTGYWVTFTATAAGAVTINVNGATNLGAAVYDACGGTEIFCNNNTLGAGAELTGLTSGVDYYVYFWLDTPSGIIDVCFEEITCANPSGMAAANITSISADLSWSAGGGETDWNLEWKAGADFAPGNGEEDAADTATGTPDYAAAGLTSSTEYFVYYQADCGADTSDWVGPFTFVTGCAPLVPDYLESFNSFTPVCWVEAGAGNPTVGPSDFGAGFWNHDEFLNIGTTNNAAQINLFFNNREDFLISPEFDLSAGGYELVYTTAITDFGNSNPPELNGMGSDDEVQVLITDDAGATWTNLTTYNQSSFPSSTGDIETFDLSAYTGIVQFAIWATDGTVNDAEDYDFFIDEFIVRTPLACTSSVVDASAVSEDCANTQFFVNVDITTVGDATQISDGTNTYPITGIGVLPVGPFPSGATATLSVVHSDPACDFNLGDFTFTCPPPNDDFANAIPISCGSTYTGSTAGATIDEDDAPDGVNADLDTQNIWYSYTGSGAPEDVTLSTCGVVNTDYDTEALIYTGTSGNLTLVAEGYDECGGSAEGFHFETTFTSDGTSTYWISMSGYNGAFGNFELVVSCVSLSVDEEIFAGLTYYPNPVKNTVTLNAQNTIDTITVINMLGQEVLRTSPNLMNSELDMSQLQTGTYFVTVTINAVSETIRVIKQ